MIAVLGWFDLERTVFNIEVVGQALSKPAEALLPVHGGIVDDHAWHRQDMRTDRE
ncbi:conserved hypothetical protein [Frankia sp. Hr75.2]|nr:conserved hypothetical protein [Frankia sp. Hr75.2]